MGRLIAGLMLGAAFIAAMFIATQRESAA